VASLVVGQPYLWLLGALSVALRGGIVLLVLPIIVLPTPVEVRLALGANLGSAGLTPDFWSLVALATAASALIALAVLICLAWIEMAAFERVTAGAQPVQPRRRGLLGRLFVIQALSLLAIAVCAIPLAAMIGQATYDELLRPSSNASIYVRVIGQLVPALIPFVAAVVVIDALSAIATRRLLAQRRSLLAAVAGALVEPLRSTLRTFVTVLVGWSATIAVLGAAWLGLSLAWRFTRGSFLAITSIFEPGQLILPILVALFLTAVFAVSVLSAGVASAFRSVLWSVQFKR